MRNPNSEIPNYNNNIYNSNTYTKWRAFSNRDKNNWNNFYNKGKKEESELVSKPMFTNSKLENNGNPEGNFVKIEVSHEEEKKHFNLTNIGEVSIDDNQSNSLLAIKSLLMGKDPEKKEDKKDEEKTNENKNNEISLSMNNNNSINNTNNSNNDNSSSLPWRSGSYFGGKGGGYKKDYYSKTYRNKKDNNFYYSSGKNYNKNRYSLNQPQSKKSNKFD